MLIAVKEVFFLFLLADNQLDVKIVVRLFRDLINDLFLILFFLIIKHLLGLVFIEEVFDNF